MVVQANNVKLLPVNHSSAVDKLLDYMPDAIDKVNGLINKQMQMKKEEKTKEQNNNTNNSNKENKTEKQATSSRIKPRRNRGRTNEILEYEYDEVPKADDLFTDVEDIEDFDD